MQDRNLRAKDVDGDLHYFSIYQIRSGPDETGVYYVAINDALIPIEAGTEQWATGLKDKNGREIYEGDIIESEEIDFNDSGSYAGMKRVCGSVVFMSGKFIFHKTTGALADVSTASIYNKVIGNIYENPELLEV